MLHVCCMLCYLASLLACHLACFGVPVGCGAAGLLGDDRAGDRAGLRPCPWRAVCVPPFRLPSGWLVYHACCARPFLRGFTPRFIACYLFTIARNSSAIIGASMPRKSSAGICHSGRLPLYGWLFRYGLVIITPTHSPSVQALQLSSGYRR